MQRSFAGVVLVLTPIAGLVYGSLHTRNWGAPLTVAEVNGLIAFVSVAVLAEMFAVDFSAAPGQRSKSSLAFLPFLGVIALFPPPVAALAVAGVVAFSQIVIRRTDFYRYVANSSSALLTSSVAAVVHHGVFLWLGGTAFATTAAFAVMAVAFLAGNLLISACGLAYVRATPVRVLLSQIAGPNGSNLRYDLLATPIAIVPVLLYGMSTVLGVLVIVLPLLLINYSYVSKIQVIEANKDLLRALVTAIETRDPYTSGHSERVAALAKRIAIAMGMPFRKVNEIETAALLHDIGKIQPIFSEVLRKPHSLTQAERELIQTHAARGAEFLSGLSTVPKVVIEAVMHHHERFDGLGYPSGIAGRDIPLAARIIMLCDSVDAMLSDRPYRRALPLAVVKTELANHAGSQFDPAIVEVVLRHSVLDAAGSLVDADSARNLQSRSEAALAV